MSHWAINTELPTLHMKALRSVPVKAEVDSFDANLTEWG
jgi:hypothetical protein